MTAHAPLKDRLAAVIRDHRVAMQVSQEAFADRVQMHRAFYGRVENGQNVTLQTLQRVASGLGVAAWKLLREAEETH